MSIIVHGVTYLVFVGCALWGAANILASAHAWAEDRVTRTGWRFYRRWDRPGVPVVLPDGREGAIETVYRGEAAGSLAVVIFEDADPEYVPVLSLMPAPAVAREAEAA